MTLNGMLANAGLFDVAFAQALIALGIAGLGAIFGICGFAYGWLCRDVCRAAAILPGILALAGAFGYAGFFWASNGDGAWEHACRHLAFNAIVFGLPFLTGVGAILMGSLRRKGEA